MYTSAGWSRRRSTKITSRFPVSTETVVFTRELAARIPALQPILRDHIYDNAEILPHLFMVDLFRWAVKEAESPELNSGSLRAGSLAAVGGKLCAVTGRSPGRQHSRQPDCRSFLEYLLAPSDRVEPLIALLGPSMAGFLPRHPQGGDGWEVRRAARVLGAVIATNGIGKPRPVAWHRPRGCHHLRVATGQSTHMRSCQEPRS